MCLPGRQLQDHVIFMAKSNGHSCDDCSSQHTREKNNICMQKSNIFMLCIFRFLCQGKSNTWGISFIKKGVMAGCWSKSFPTVSDGGHSISEKTFKKSKFQGEIIEYRTILCESLLCCLSVPFFRIRKGFADAFKSNLIKQHFAISVGIIITQK